jgi:hypothetical protein
MSARRLVIAFVMFSVLLLAGACDTSSRDASNTIPTTGADGLPALTVAPVSHRDTYERDEFGDGWRDADGDCLNTRAEVLIAESNVRPTVAGCKVRAGEWSDPWSLITTTDPAALGIDHMVALANAWRSGAWAWTRDRRVAFANDLRDPDALNALITSENDRKGDSGPDGWRPPDRTTWCRYARSWARIKAQWGLTVTHDEWLALRAMVETCPR